MVPYGPCLSDKTLFLKGTNGLGADFHLYLFAFNNDCFSLEVGIPNLLGVALAKADVVAELFALAGEFTLLHVIYPIYT